MFQIQTTNYDVFSEAVPFVSSALSLPSLSRFSVLLEGFFWIFFSPQPPPSLPYIDVGHVFITVPPGSIVTASSCHGVRLSSSMYTKIYNCVFFVHCTQQEETVVAIELLTASPRPRNRVFPQCLEHQSVPRKNKNTAVFEQPPYSADPAARDF